MAVEILQRNGESRGFRPGELPPSIMDIYNEGFTIRDF
jgi:hypothetical protein